MIIPKEDLEFYFIPNPIIKKDFYWHKDIGMVLLDDLLPYLSFNELKGTKYKRYYAHIYIDGKIDIIRFGYTIYRILLENEDKMGNKFHLKCEEKYGYPCFDESKFTEETCIYSVNEESE